MKTDDPIILRQALEEARREITYLRRNSEHTMARLLNSNIQAIAFRHELEQKRRGFKLMAELAVTISRQGADYQTMLLSVSRRLNAALNMQRTAVLTPVADNNNLFRAQVLQGYPAEERKLIQSRLIKVPQELLNPRRPVLVTYADPDDRLASFRKDLALPVLISTPITTYDEIAALLVTGRMCEQHPFYTRLGDSDAETVQTVGAYLAAILTNQRLRHAEILANHDSLTQLPNLRKTTEWLHRALPLARREALTTAIMFLDLDGFKTINDTHGHAAGDMVLKIVADRLTNCIRKSDLVGRIGGDEFIIVLTHVNRPEEAGLVADKILQKISEPMNVQETICQVGASVGIAIFPEHGQDAATLIQAADEAMYLVKSKGKNNYCYAGSLNIGAPAVIPRLSPLL